MYVFVVFAFLKTDDSRSPKAESSTRKFPASCFVSHLAANDGYSHTL
jgi:hypothetical protein